MKFSKPFVIMLVVTVLVNMWALLLAGFKDVPVCQGVEVTLTAVIPTNGLTNWIHGTSSDGKEVYGQISTDAQVGDTLTIYTSDGSNYWDVSEDLAFCDGMLNKPSGFLALGIRSAKGLSVLMTIVDALAGASFYTVIGWLVLRWLKKRKHPISS